MKASSIASALTYISLVTTAQRSFVVAAPVASTNISAASFENGPDSILSLESDPAGSIAGNFSNLHPSRAKMLDGTDSGQCPKITWFAMDCAAVEDEIKKTHPDAQTLMEQMEVHRKHSADISEMKALAEREGANPPPKLLGHEKQTVVVEQRIPLGTVLLVWSPIGLVVTLIFVHALTRERGN